MSGSESKATTDHQTIKNWAEDRQGRPAVVQDTDLLRIDFGHEESNLKYIEWDEFFDIFEKNSLAFLHQDLTPTGEVSRFCKFVGR